MEGPESVAPTAPTTGKALPDLPMCGWDYVSAMAPSDLADTLRWHQADPFPVSVEKGRDYGEVEPVMIAADIYGWALGVSRGSSLSALDRTRLRQAAGELQRSLQAFPADAQPYFERVLRIARLALTAH